MCVYMCVCVFTRGNSRGNTLRNFPSFGGLF